MPLGERIAINTKNPYLSLEIYKGHYATSHSHTNYYIDITNNMSNLAQARAVAKELAENYKHSTIVDTILCLDGTEVIGTCLATELTNKDIYNVNAGRDIFILTPEHSSGSQLFFRDNTAPMIIEKQVLILAASVVTGFTAKAAVESVNYYSGNVVGITSIFATINDCVGVPVTSVFDPNDLPGYATYLSTDCEMCRHGEKINALVNSHGCSLL